MGLLLLLGLSIPCLRTLPRFCRLRPIGERAVLERTSCLDAKACRAGIVGAFRDYKRDYGGSVLGIIGAPLTSSGDYSTSPSVLIRRRYLCVLHSKHLRWYVGSIEGPSVLAQSPKLVRHPMYAPKAADADVMRRSALTPRQYLLLSSRGWGAERTM